MGLNNITADDLFASEGVFLSTLELKILTKLYQPLIGHEAYALYLTLADGFDLNRVKSLVMAMNMSLAKISNNIDLLEGLGLVVTYHKNETDHQMYQFVMKKPIDVMHFFNNPLLVNRLAEALGKDAFLKTRSLFVKDDLNLNEYQNVTKKYNEVFPLNYDLNLVDEDAHYINNAPAQIKSDIDFTVFKNALKEYDLQMLLLNKEKKNYLEMLMIEYKLTIDEMVEAILVSLVGKDVDFNALEGYLKQLNNYRQDQCEFKKIYLKKVESDNIYDSLSVYEYLQRWQDIYKIELSDYKQMETIMNKFPLSNGVYNYLIEALIKKQNSLNLNYLEKTAKTWFQQNVKEVAQAQAIAAKWGSGKVNNKSNVKTIGSTADWYQDKDVKKVSSKELAEIKKRQAKM